MNKNLIYTLLLSPVLLLSFNSAVAGVNNPIELQMIAHEAMDGDDGAQLLYGLAYLHGQNGLEVDAKKGVYWLLRSSRIGNTYAQLVLGNCYADGDGVEKDAKQAVRWWRKASEKDNEQAQYLIGKAYLEGNGVTKDTAQAIDWLQQSAEQGDKEAQFLLGKLYHEGYVIKSDSEVAKHWLHRAANQAHSGAIDLLALIKGIYHSATIVYQESSEVLIDRAKHGEVEAQYELALRYESGAWDVEKDNEKALMWFHKAAGSGHSLAMKTLSGIYKHGDLGVVANDDTALEWLNRASLKP